MFEPLIKAIQKSAQAQLVSADSSSVYTDKSLQWLPQRQVEELGTRSLESVVIYCNELSPTDGENIAAILVKDHKTVAVLGELNVVTGARTKLLLSVAKLPVFNFGQYYDREEFQIAIASKFVQCENLSTIIALVGKMTNQILKTVEDDGISQTVSVRAGISMSGDVTVPPRVRLTPCRTFFEVEQPTSEFLFRMRKGKNEQIECALFEADGGAWKAEAQENIVLWLKESLGDSAPVILF